LFARADRPACITTDIEPLLSNSPRKQRTEAASRLFTRLHRGTTQVFNLEPAALYLYRDWLPASGEEARDFPIYCQRPSFFPEVPEPDAVAELFLPLK
jgi:AraC family transcriptional regulator